MEQNEMIYIVPHNEEEYLLLEDNDILNKVDFVLVAAKVENGKDKKETNRKRYLRKVREKGFRIMRKEDNHNLYFGIQAREEIFDKYIQHLKLSERKYDNELKEISKATRIRIINFILWKIRYSTNNGNDNSLNAKNSLRKLLDDGTFKAVFPLHEKCCCRGHEVHGSKEQCWLCKDGNWQKERKLRFEWAEWRCLFKKQPIEEIREYFGERIALYFAWLGWYTTLLIPAAICGVIVVLYGFIYFESDHVSKEICNGTGIIMCPLCDKRCQYWRLNETCSYAKITQLFDHEGTVVFAMFMAIWATVFLELWKRARARSVCSWDLYHWDEDEEELALGLLYNPDVKAKEYHHSYKRTTIVMLLACILITVIIGLSLGIVICRVIAAVTFTKSGSEFLSDHARSIAVMVGAVLHFFTILIMTKINRKVAKKLCDLEGPRTALARENNFSVKMFTFQFFTMFSSIVYIAFFLGRINGHPNGYVRIAGQWRLEECHPSGCMTDLFIQMAVVMILKQILSSCVQYAVPSLKYQWKKYNKKNTDNDVTDATTKHWVKNYNLNHVDSFSLFNEFLEMAIQYGFTTIFVAAFPLAPLLAFLNNLFEIRLDARKMLVLQKRPIPRKAKDIGIWVRLLEVVGVLAVIGNGLVISITSDFIPRLVYKYGYGPCAFGNSSNVNCMMGYVNSSLSVFYVENFKQTDPKDDGLKSFGFQVTYCRYRDYRTVDDYKYTVQFWHIFAARLAFLILFENIVICIKYIVAWFVPDTPTSVRNHNLQKTFMRLQKELELSREIPSYSNTNAWKYQSTDV
ncbi:anoctamin-9-like isoform X1 [Chiloscyllium plagiosum]|uniref:anoctamin-9-like isoform X1 n=1 Tax=Chiloscyllium plagiosum TaxID=36176 RepID=UPI001CB8733D|nr:anoctamin-9-like isoform X1 [Chiloscyllium plagiosum]